MIDQAGRTRKSKKKTKRERENNKGWAEGCREELVLNLHVDEYTHARQRGFIAERRAFGNLVNHFFTFFPYWLEDTDEYFGPHLPYDPTKIVDPCEGVPEAQKPQVHQHVQWLIGVCRARDCDC